jgi:hypothetical protein
MGASPQVIDVYLVRGENYLGFIPRQAIYRGQTNEWWGRRILELQEEFPVIGEWVYRKLPTGQLQKWQFLGRYR